MTNILGISAYYHDSAACLVRDGKIIAAAQEERFTRKKHDAGFPREAIDYCLKTGGITKEQLDLVVFYDKPFTKFERLLQTYLAYAPLGLPSFIKAMSTWIKQKLWIKDLIEEDLAPYKGKILFTEHHESHSASAFFPSPFQEAAVLTMDGVGEWATASFGTGKGNRIELTEELVFPHSLGLLYSAFTYYTGFKVNSGEYKLMGLAPYGEPRYTQVILDNLLDLKEDGSFKLNLKYFDYPVGLKMVNRKFEKLFGHPARKKESRITQFEMDIASSIQKVTEEIVLRMGNYVHKKTGMENLCLAGGVALNCVANGELLRRGPFKNIWIQPAAGDAGGALGAALFGWYQYLDNPRRANGTDDFLEGSLLGPGYTDDEIEAYLKKENIPFKKLAESQFADTIADLIAGENVIGWFQGRMEFGPRALGARSILGDARSPRMQEVMNLKIKFRESFRPFAPAVLREHVSDYFEHSSESPYMLMVAPVRRELQKQMTGDEEKLFGIEKLSIARSTIPAVTHVDYSARLQTVDAKSNPKFHALLSSLKSRHDCAVIINTSFNVRGEPIVCTPQDAFRCFMRTNMDYLVLGNCLLDKKEQTPVEKDSDWQKEFELD